MEELIKKILKEVLQEMTATSQINEIMTIKQLSEYLQVSEAWIYKHMQSIPHLKLSSSTRFRKLDVDEWLSEQSTYSHKKVNMKVV